MTRRISGLLSAALLVAVLACKDDPTSSLRGGVASFSANPNPAFVNANDTVPITVFARDAQLNPLAADFTATVDNGATASLTLDNTTPDPSGRVRKYNVAGLAPGQTFVTLSAGGVSSKDTINVMPVNFNGTVSSGTPAGGAAVTINGTSVLTFTPGTSTVTFGAGGAGLVTASSASALTVLVPFGATGNPTISGVRVSFLPGFSTSLAAAFTVTQTGNRWTGDDAFATAADITSIIPASAGTARLLSRMPAGNGAECPEVAQGFGSTGGCAIFKFTVTGGPVTLAFSADWTTTGDVDIYHCAPAETAATCSFESGGSGAGSSHPESISPFAFPNGTHFFVIETYGGTAPTNVYVTITRS